MGPATKAEKPRYTLQERTFLEKKMCFHLIPCRRVSNVHFILIYLYLALHKKINAIQFNIFGYEYSVHGSVVKSVPSLKGNTIIKHVKC